MGLLCHVWENLQILFYSMFILYQLFCVIALLIVQDNLFLFHFVLNV